VELVLERPVQDDGAVATMTDDELAHAVMLSISEQLGWDSKTTVNWYAFALPHNASDNKLITIQVRMSRDPHTWSTCHIFMITVMLLRRNSVASL